MKKIYFLSILSFYLILDFNPLFSQQFPDFSLFRENVFLFNPAVAGTEQAMVGNISLRKQFSNINDAPFSANLAFHTFIKDKNIGLGGYLFNDFTGPTSFTGLNFSFAYHIVFSEYRAGLSEYKALSFGLSLSAVQHRLNANKIKLDQEIDEALFRTRGSQFFPDASFGIHYKSKRLFVSASVPQLLHLDVPINGQNGEETRLKKMQHYFLMAGYRIFLEKNAQRNHPLYFEPAVNAHYVIGAPPQAVFSTRFGMDELFFIGAGYRSLATVVFEGGITINRNLNIFYAYDHAAGRSIRQDVGQTHEIGISYRFMKEYWSY